MLVLLSAVALGVVALVGGGWLRVELFGVVGRLIGREGGAPPHSAVMPVDRVDGVVHLPSRSMSQTMTDTSRPGLHDVTVTVIDHDHFMRTRTDRTWLDAQ
jgi:hypothetical protein